MEINSDLITLLNKKVSEDTSNKLAMNVVGRVELQELAVNRDLIKSIDFSFSDELDVAPEATAQQKVGVCWMFAALNLMRYITQKKINVKTFEYSGPYLMFWDKLEKANYFLEKMIQFRDTDYDERTLRLFLSDPIPDGGDWYMFVNLVKKYGVVPASVMQHAAYSKDSLKHNEVIAGKLRQYASVIRRMHKEGKTLEEIQSERLKFTEEIYKILVICFGTPPTKFDWSYRNEDKQFFREKDITPHQFFEKYVDVDLDDYVCVWNCPMEDTPYNKVYSIAHTRKMVKGPRHQALNLHFDEFKEFALKKLKNHEPILFSCDVSKDSLRKEGLLVKGIYNYDLIFQTRFGVDDRSTRLEMGDTHLTHCMLIVGVDLDGDKPVKWKVENSWGSEVGKKGFFVMSDGWFDDNVYQLIVQKKHLSPEQLELLKQEPVMLPLWHPMF
jgi:bleomycin hydrolase